MISPFRKYGVLGGKLKQPRNLDEAVTALGCILSPEDKGLIEEWREAKFVALHHTLGRWIRNNWGLWNEKSKLHKWFKSKGIWHADDMSCIILTTYYRRTHNLPEKFKEQVLYYIEYWRHQKALGR